MGDYGFKISQDGFDVKTCADKDLVSSSKFNQLKTAVTGTANASTSIVHGLSYTPIFFTIATGYSFIGDDSSNCDSINLNILNNNTRYYIFYQQAN